MTWISVDVEADGPIPGFGENETTGYSMIAIGACIVKEPRNGFLGYLQPISEQWIPEALAVSGFSREETLEFPRPVVTMAAFRRWILDNADPPYIFVADNNGFDAAWTNWYFHQFSPHDDRPNPREGVGRNPFGFSSKNINNLYQGMVGNAHKSFKWLRDTKHDHNPMHDAQGNAESLLKMQAGIVVDGIEYKLGVKF